MITETEKILLINSIDLTIENISNSINTQINPSANIPPTNIENIFI